MKGSFALRHNSIQSIQDVMKYFMKLCVCKSQVAAVAVW